MIVGTAGHIDHGKTSLVRALTGVDTDRLKEEKERGITIDLGFAYLPGIDGRIIGFVDVPGHERFVHNMLAGATGIDFVLLVVAADDGIMPQTLEHLAIVDLLGIQRGLIALTKSDLVTSDRLAQVKDEIADALLPTVMAGSEILPISAVTGAGIDALRDKLFKTACALGDRDAKGLFRLAVDRSFTLQGIGTVVTGTVLSGKAETGAQVLVSPSGLSARIRSIHAQNRPTPIARAGDRCALNLAGDGISKEAIKRGDVVLDPALHAPADRIDSTLRVLPSEAKSIGQWTPVRLHHAATEIGARIVLLCDGPIAPGQEAFIQLVLERPIAAAAGDRFVLRDTSSRRTVGGGRFLDLRAPTRRRRTPERLAQLRACAVSDPERALIGLLEQPPGYVDLTTYARDRALGPDEIEAFIERNGLVRITTANTALAVSAANWQRFKHSMVATLGKFHAENPDLPGIGLERIRLQLEPRFPAPAFVALLQALQRNKEVTLDGAWVRLPSHEVKLTPQDEALWAKIRPMLGGDARFRPPRARDIADALRIPEGHVRRLCKLLCRLGQADEVAHDHFFLRAAVTEMVDASIKLAESKKDGQFSAADFRDRLNNGRKMAIQVLEFFDRHGVTLRRGDWRRVNKHRIDLFRRFGAGTVDPPLKSHLGREASPVGRPDFKSGKGRETVLSGFDSHSLPPNLRKASP